MYLLFMVSSFGFSVQLNVQDNSMMHSDKSDHRFLCCHDSLGDNFFKSASYTIEALCAAPFIEKKEELRDVEAQILTKRVELSKFENEYKEVCVLTPVVCMPV